MQNYKSWVAVVPSSGILLVEKNNIKKICLKNVTNILGTASSSDDLISLSLQTEGGISEKVTRSSTAIKTVFGSPQSHGIAVSLGSSSPFSQIKTVGLSVSAKKLTLTIPSGSPLLAVGTHVRLKDINAAGSGAMPYMGQALAVVSKTSDTVYGLGAIIPSSVTIGSGATATVENLGFSIPTENAHPYLISKREGAFVTFTMSISEQLFQMNDVMKDENTYHMIISGDSDILNRKQNERVQLLISSISNNGTGNVVVEDPDYVIDETYAVKSTDRIAIECGPVRSVRFGVNYVYFTSLKAGDKYEIETFCSQT